MDTTPTPVSRSVDQNATRMHDNPHERRHEESQSGSGSISAAKPHKAHHHHSSHRGPTRYKEKFQAMRERYDQVTAKREAYNRELEIASTKQKQLQAENDLLLDTISIALSPSQSSYRHPPPPRLSAQTDIPLAPQDSSLDSPTSHIPISDGGRHSHRLSHSNSRDSLHHSNGVPNGSTPNGTAARLRGPGPGEPVEGSGREDNQS